jgi:hypothetical protein
LSFYRDLGGKRLFLTVKVLPYLRPKIGGEIEQKTLILLGVVLGFSAFGRSMKVKT